MKFEDKTYDKLKWIAQYLIPAVGTLYFALARIWNLPYAEEIVGTLTAIDTFLGVLLGISSSNYEPKPDAIVDLEAITDENDDTNLERTISFPNGVESVLDKDYILVKNSAKK